MLQNSMNSARQPGLPMDLHNAEVLQQLSVQEQCYCFASLLKTKQMGIRTFGFNHSPLPRPAPGSPSAWLLPALHALVYGKQSALHCISARSVQGWHLAAGAVSMAAAAQPALRNSRAKREADTLPNTSPEQSCQHYKPWQTERTTESCSPSCPGQHCVGLSPAALSSHGPCSPVHTAGIGL